jgi:tRNA A37 threonylcarbamoyladenosine biosynthesis protein TsaE
MLFLLNLFAKCKYQSDRRIHLTIYQSNATVYLSDRAGTGKTTLLREIIETTHKNTVVVAPQELLP